MLKCPCSHGEWVHLQNVWASLQRELMPQTRGAGCSPGPSYPFWHLVMPASLGEVSWQNAPRFSIWRFLSTFFHQAFFAGCLVAAGGHGPTFPKSTQILELDEFEVQQSPLGFSVLRLQLQAGLTQSSPKSRWDCPARSCY